MSEENQIKRKAKLWLSEYRSNQDVNIANESLDNTKASNIFNMCRANQYLILKFHMELSDELRNLQQTLIGVIGARNEEITEELKDLRKRIDNINTNPGSSNQVEALSKAINEIKIDEEGITKKIGDIQNKVNSLQPATLAKKSQPNFGWTREPYESELKAIWEADLTKYDKNKEKEST